jgi:hypothetical protein
MCYDTASTYDVTMIPLIIGYSDTSSFNQVFQKTKLVFSSTRAYLYEKSILFKWDFRLYLTGS